MSSKLNLHLTPVLLLSENSMTISSTPVFTAQKHNKYAQYKINKVYLVWIIRAFDDDIVLKESNRSPLEIHKDFSIE